MHNWSHAVFIFMHYMFTSYAILQMPNKADADTQSDISTVFSDDVAFVIVSCLYDTHLAKFKNSIPLVSQWVIANA